jgi:undecaprenyl pyrophosphate phosphatase UppP
MLQPIVQHVKLSVSSALTKVAGRAVVIVALIIAACFAIAAIELLLAQYFGWLWANAILAVLFLIVGGIAAIYSSSQEKQQEQALHNATLQRSALISGLVAGGPMALSGTMRLLGRRGPIVLGGLALAVYLISRSKQGDSHKS